MIKISKKADYAVLIMAALAMRTRPAADDGSAPVTVCAHQPVTSYRSCPCFALSLCDMSAAPTRSRARTQLAQVHPVFFWTAASLIPASRAWSSGPGSDFDSFSSRRARAAV